MSICIKSYYNNLYSQLIDNIIYHPMTSYIKGAALGSNDLFPGNKSKHPGVYAKVMGINQLN